MIKGSFASFPFMQTVTETCRHAMPCGAARFLITDSTQYRHPCTGLIWCDATLTRRALTGINGMLRYTERHPTVYPLKCKRSAPWNAAATHTMIQPLTSKCPQLSHLNSWKIGGDMILNSVSHPRISTLMSRCGHAICSYPPWEMTGSQNCRRPWAITGLFIPLRLSSLTSALFSSRLASGAPLRDSGIANGVQQRKMPVHRQQAQEGETFVGGAATYVHGEQAASEVANEIREAIKEMIAFNLMPATALALRFSGNAFPGIANPQILAAEAMFWSLGNPVMQHLLDDLSTRTAVEAGDGHFPAVIPHRRGNRLSTPAQLTAIFDESIMPAALQHSTRTSYFASWKVVLAWGIAHDEVRLLLPMSQDTLKALTQELLMVGCSAGSIRNIWSAIENRHRCFGYPPPLAIEGDFSRMARAVGSVRGQPSRLIFPVGVHHVQRLVELIGLSLTQRRDMLICVLGTVACLRVGEVENLQLCDLRWGHDAAWHSDYEGTMAVGVYKRKQDQVRKGLFPRVGSSVTNRLRAFVEELGLEVSDECSKERAPGARCRTCPPVFPRVVNGTEHSRPVSRQQVTNAVLNSLRMLEADTTHFSGLSMRRGGISAALVARVPEPILFLQSGHGSNNAARNYTVPRNPHILFETYNAFGI